MPPIITNFKYTTHPNLISKTYNFTWDPVIQPVSTLVYFDIYLNNNIYARTSDFFFSLGSGVGCEHKCIKIKTVFETSSIFSYSGFSSELCFTSPADRYCNLSMNLWQNQKISKQEEKEYQF